MKNINEIKNNIQNKKITILGSGISGVGAARLANFLGAKVLISTNKNNHPKNIKKNICIEFSHSNECLKSDLVIISPGINPKSCKIVKKIENHNIPIISEIEFGYWFAKYPIIGITGSNGKSTVVKIIYDMFNKKYKNVLLGGNIGISFCDNVIKEHKSNTKSLIHILELSSFQLQRINKFKPDVSCILNIQKDHIDRHEKFSNYFNAKMNIIKNYDTDCSIIYNQDDRNLHQYFRKNNIATPYSINKKNHLFVKENKIYSSKTKKIIINQEDTKLIGLHNLSNIIASIKIAKLFNINDKDIKEALIDFKPLEHRMEKLFINTNITYINDSKGTNLHSTDSALNSFKNKIILILGGFSKDKIDSKEILNLINKNNIIRIVCYGKVGRELHDIISYHKKSNYIKEFKKAIEEAISNARKDNIVLFSPGFKSFDQFKNFGERGNKFKEIVYKYYA